MYFRCSFVWLPVFAQIPTRVDDFGTIFRNDEDANDNQNTKIEDRQKTLLDVLEDSFRYRNGSLPFQISASLFKDSLRNFFLYFEFDVDEILLEQYFSVLDTIMTETEILDFTNTVFTLTSELYEEEINHQKEMTELDWLGFLTLNFVVDFLDENPTEEKDFRNHMETLVNYMRHLFTFSGKSQKPLVISVGEFQESLMKLFNFLGFETEESRDEKYPSAFDESTSEEEIIDLNINLVQLYIEAYKNEERSEEMSETEWLASNTLNFIIDVLKTRPSEFNKINSILSGYFFQFPLS